RRACARRCRYRLPPARRPPDGPTCSDTPGLPRGARPLTRRSIRRSPRGSPPGPERTLDPRPGLATLAVCDDGLPLLAKTGDSERHDVAGLEIFGLGLHAHPDPRRRAGGDDVARQQRHVFRHVGNEVRDAENHRARVAALALLAVDVEPHVEILRVLDLLARDQPRTDRTERVAALALAPLRGAALHLVLPLRHVVDDAIARDMLERILLVDVACSLADDHAEFDLPVGVGRLRG